MTPRQHSAYQAAQAVLAGTADIAAVANAFGLPLDLPPDGVYAALMDLAKGPPAQVRSITTAPARPGPTKAEAAGAVDPQAAKARADRQAADRAKSNLSVLRSYRIKP